MAVDPKWEFDCPQYVDFNQPLHSDETVDSFFDCHPQVSADSTTILPGVNDVSESQSVKSKEKEKQTLGKRKKDFSGCLQAMSDTLSKLYPLRLTPSRLAREAIDSPRRKKKCFDMLSKEVDNIGTQNNTGNEKYPNNVICFPVQKSHVTSSPLSSNSFTASKRSIASPKKAKRSRTPQHVRKTMDKLSKKFIKSSEEMEIDKIKELRKQLVAHRKLSKQSMKKALLNHTNLSQNSSVSSQNQHTIIRPFKFATDSRIRNKNNAEIENRKERDFVYSLRSNSPQQFHLSEKVTKPVPFKLSKNRKRKFDEVREPYCSLAEQIEEFQHGKAFATVNNTTKDFQCKLTRPRTPNLQAYARCRPVTALSQVEKEDLLIQEMKSYKFKASAINSKIMEKPYTVKSLEHRTTTRPEDVHLETEKRYVLREQNCSRQDEIKYEFHANPAPKKILEKIVGLKPKVEFPSTEPQSPMFALKQRAQTWNNKIDSEKNTETIIPPFKAHPLPHSGIQFWPKFQKKTTVVEPFSFQEQDDERWARKEKKIQEEIEKQSKRPEFKAKPILTPSKSNLPIIPKMPLTQVQPFNLLADQLGSRRAKEFEKQVEEELLKQKESTVFKAGPNKAIYSKPFVPTGSLKPLSDVECIKLHTEWRAEEREKFEYQKLLRQRELEEEHERQQKEQKQKEDAEIARLRMETVHKAMPVKHYKLKPIQRSKAELTQPHSPFLSTRLRSRNRYNSK